MRFAEIFTAFLSCLVLTNQVQGQHWDNVSELTSSLFTGYDKRLRPVLDQSKPVVVNVTFDLIALQDFDEVKEKFSVVGMLYILWQDQKLQWNPWFKAGITNLMLPISDIWYPKLIMTSPYTKLDGLADDWMTARVFYHGYVFFVPGSVFHATCSVDVTYYPFDRQSCSLTFVPWGFSSKEMKLVSTETSVLQSYFSENGEWTLENTTAFSYTLNDNDFINFEFKLQRKAKFVVVNVILPIIFMATINILAFVIPAEAGERVSYSVTVLLALAVFFTLVGDNLPKTSEPMPILSYYLMVILTMSTLMCVMIIINLRISHKSNKNKPPKWCQYLVRVVLCKICFGKSKFGQRTTDVVYPYTVDGQMNKSQTQDDVISGDDDDEDNEVTWKDVGDLVDVICIIGFTTASVAVNAHYIILLQSS